MNTPIELKGRLRPLSRQEPQVRIVRVTDLASEADIERRRQALLVSATTDPIPGGFGAYLFPHSAVDRPPPNAFGLPVSLNYLAAGDVIRIEPNSGQVRVLYRISSSSNSFLVTERCDNFCIMCSQPPKNRQDDWLVDELLEAIPLMPKTTPSVGITGGEPGLLGPRLVHLVEQFATHLPTTHLHILSNGRAFKDFEFASAIARVEHPALMFGIPLYSAMSNDHDFVVQAQGAYDDTIRGIVNLKRCGVHVELRMVIHRQTVDGLPEFASFVARNLVFVDHVALMGLELMGFAKTNLETLWVDPVDYITPLTQAVTTLDRCGVPVSIYNHQLCTLPKLLWPFNRRSISDWKNEYLSDCETCAVKNDCGGFFASSHLRRSRGISPVLGASQ